MGSDRKMRGTSVRTATCKTERPWCILMTSLHTTHPDMFTAQQVSPHHRTPVPHPDLCHPPICFDLFLFPPSHLLILFFPLLCWNTNNTMGLIFVYLPKIPSSAGSKSARALLAAWCVCFVWAYVRVWVALSVATLFFFFFTGIELDPARPLYNEWIENISLWNAVCEERRP